MFKQNLIKAFISQNAKKPISVILKFKIIAG